MAVILSAALAAIQIRSTISRGLKALHLAKRTCMCVCQTAMPLAWYCSIMPHWLMSCYAHLLFLSAPIEPVTI